MQRGLLVVAGAATAVLMSRRRSSRHKDFRDDQSVTSAGSHQLLDLGPGGELEPVLEETSEDIIRANRRRQRRRYCLGWDQLLVLVLALSALGLSMKRKAWDVAGAVG